MLGENCFNSSLFIFYHHEMLLVEPRVTNNVQLYWNQKYKQFADNSSPPPSQKITFYMLRRVFIQQKSNWFSFLKKLVSLFYSGVWTYKAVLGTI